MGAIRTCPDINCTNPANDGPGTVGELCDPCRAGFDAQMASLNLPQMPRPGVIQKAYRAGDKDRVLHAIYSGVTEVFRTSHEAPCWEWNGARRADGYAALGMQGKTTMGVHRLSAWASKDDYSSDMPVHHICANRACCNPEHLQVVSHQENTAEMVERNNYLRKIKELERENAQLRAALSEFQDQQNTVALVAAR